MVSTQTSSSSDAAHVANELSSFGITAKDLAFLTSHGRRLEDVALECNVLCGEPKYAQVLSPATIKNGYITPFTAEQLSEYREIFRSRIGEGIFTSFVPAAGAATRQLQLLKTVLSAECLSAAKTPTDIINAAQQEIVRISSLKGPSEQDKAEAKNLQEVVTCLERMWNKGLVNRGYAFCNALDRELSKRGTSLQDSIEGGDLRTIASAIIGEDGLGYQNLPKLLMSIHSYVGPQGIETRIMLEEHLREAALLQKNSPNLNLHFAISEEHEFLAQRALQSLWEKALFVEFMSEQGFNRDSVKVEFSFQAPSTDTVALNLSNRTIARDNNGDVLLRKGGHGALLSNLSRIDSEAIWLQNVDNVLFDNPQIKAVVVAYKQAMAGLGLQLQEESHRLIKMLRALDGKTEAMQEDALNTATRFIEEKLRCQILSNAAQSAEFKEKRDVLCAILDRPIVVAGFVPLRKGQNGGGPFLVKIELAPGVVAQKTSIVEASEFERGADNEAYKAGTFFNPVLAVIVRGKVDGGYHDLESMIDSTRYFRSVKASAQGMVGTVELPGLWNGSLAKAHQVSVAVPAFIFSAIKDLAGPESFLAEMHQPFSGDPFTQFTAHLDTESGAVVPGIAEYFSAEG